MRNLQRSELLALVVLAVSCLLICDSVSATGGSAADARVLCSQESVDIKKDETAVYRIKRRIKVFAERGKHYATIHAAETMFEKILDVSGSVYDGSGKLILKRRKGDLEKYCGFGEYQLFSDICDYYLSLAAGNYPFTVEYEVTQEVKSLFAWPGWSPQWFIPVDTAVYVLTRPEGVDYRTRVTGDVGEPAVSDVDGRRTLTWTVYDLPAFEDEPFMPPVASYVPGLDFAVDRFKYGKYAVDCSDWRVASQSIFQVMKGAFKLSQAQLSVLDSLVPTPPATVAECNRLHEYLSKRSRYVAVSIGVGGWQPHASDITFAHGYGDCKDLATMYVSMLGRIGIEAHPALVLTREDGRTDPTFPRMNFNHAILYLVQEADTTWVDPTCFSCRLGDLPWTDEGIFALAIDSTHGTIIRTPASTAADNVIVRKASISVNSDLTLTVSVDIYAVGNPGSRLRGLSGTMPALELAQGLQGYQNVIGQGLQVAECRTAPDETGLSEIRLTVRGTVQRAVRRVQDKLYFDLSTLPLMNQAEQVTLSGRKYPIEFQYPYTIVDTVSIELPVGYKYAQVPDDTLVSDGFGSLQSSGRIDNRRATITREKTLVPREIETAAFDLYGEHCAQQRRIAGQAIVVEKE